MRHSERKKYLLEKGVRVASESGYDKVTFELVALKAGVSKSLVQFHFRNVKNLKNQIVRYAVSKQVIPICAQARAVKHPYLTQISSMLNNKIVDYMAGGDAHA